MLFVAFRGKEFQSLIVWIAAPLPQSRDIKAVRTGTSTKTAAEFLTFRFPISCLYNLCVSSSFCLKVCEYENLEALFLKLHKD